MTTTTSPLLALFDRFWPPVPPHLTFTFLLTFTSTPLIFLLLSQRYTSRRQRSWIATAAASGCMTVCAMPFFLDWVGSGGSLAAVQERRWLSERVCAGFMGYLISDLLTGSLFYIEHVSILMGWTHHTLYFLLLSHVLTKHWSHIFALAAIMELPTHLLALATLEPVLRNDYLFASSFFALRVCFHVVLIVQYALPSVRREVLGGGGVMHQWGPVIFLSLALPMHVIWFYGCVKGILRRQRQKREKEALAKAAEEAAKELQKETAPIDEPVHRPAAAGLTGTQTPGAEKLLAFPPAAARAVGLPTPGLTPHSSPFLRPVGASAPSADPSTKPSPAPPTANGQLTPPITPPSNSLSAASEALARAPSLLSLPNLYLPSREDVRRRLGREGRREAVRKVREAGKGVVLRVTGYAGGAAVGGAAEEVGVDEVEGVEGDEMSRSPVEVY